MANWFDDEGPEKTIVGFETTVPMSAREFGHFLIYTEGNSSIRVRINSAGVTIGRVLDNDVVINTPQISRRHCRIAPDGNGVLVTDLGSTNGTFLGGKRLEKPTYVYDDARLSLGSFAIRYERRDLQDVAEEEAHAADLRRAEDYVRAILPPPITEGPVRADWCFVPSSQLGGDAFGYQFLDNETFTGFLLDVSGHGIGSAMHAANVANTLRRRALPGVDFREPAEVAAGLNAVFPMEEHNGLMLTFWYFSYHLPTRRLRFCAGGHHAALFMPPGAAEAIPLALRGPTIGMMPQGKWAVGSGEVAPGAKLYIFSDGVFEIITAAGQEWGFDDFRWLVNAPAAPGLAEPQRLYQAVRAAARPGALDDDFSVLVVSFG